MFGAVDFLEIEDSYILLNFISCHFFLLIRKFKSMMVRVIIDREVFIAVFFSMCILV